MNSPKPELDFSPFATPLAQLLKLEAQPLPANREPFRQLGSLEYYLGQSPLPCQAMAIERHYIDRDYIEDHSIFYARSFQRYGNACQRIHFFALPPAEVEAQLKRLREVGRTQNEVAFRQDCRAFSETAYLGFSVIKPLHGCPVGRTVLRFFDGAGLPQIEATREYQTHLAGVELTVRGLAFQQQDVGVSACATIALWSSLQKLRESEEIGVATPAQITLLASRYSSPFGRSMPSEGLSLDQMCQAVRAFALAPVLLRTPTLETALGYLHAALSSDLAPILILKKEKAGVQHAVTAVGLRLGAAGSSQRQAAAPPEARDRAAELEIVFLHDDRNGPYLSARFEPSTGAPELGIELKQAGKFSIDRWLVSHVLIPVPTKVRLTFADLRRLVPDLIAMLTSARRCLFAQRGLPLLTDETVTYETRIVRARAYVEELFLGTGKLAEAPLEALLQHIALPRFVGIIRLQAAWFGTLEVLLDTTSTLSNLHCLGVILREQQAAYAPDLVDFLADETRCPAII